MRPLILLTALAAANAVELQTKIKVTGPPIGAPVTVILTRWTGRLCTDSLLRTHLPADGIIDLPANDRGPTCWLDDPLAGIAVLAQDRAVAYLSAREFPGEETPIPIEMRPRRIVNVVVHPASPRLAALARDDIAHTDWLWNRNLAGLTIRARFLPPDAKVEDTNCVNVLEPGSAFVPGEINLYYGAKGQNLSCGENSAVFVHEVPVLGDAAHELSHRLGLNQLDHGVDPLFHNGHTTNLKGFTCNNVMWTLTDTLQDELSPGQAFWMGLSCSSFAAHHGACLPCARRKGAESPCPSFSLGQDASTRPCDACDLAALQLIVGAVDTKGRNQLCDRDSLRQALTARFQDLARNPGVKPGSRNQRQFVDRWMAEIRTVLTVESVARLEDPQQRERGILHLRDLAKKAPYREHTSYLDYAALKIKFEPGYRPRCEQDQATPSTDPPPNAPANAPAAAPAPAKPPAANAP